MPLPIRFIPNPITETHVNVKAVMKQPPLYRLRKRSPCNENIQSIEKHIEFVDRTAI